MIPRYTREPMGQIWSEENKYAKWLKVEIAALEAWQALGEVPAEAVKAIREKARVDVQRIQEIEEVTQHDVIAFVEQVSASVGEHGKYLHYGLTSSDVLDTAFALMLREAGALLIDGLETLAAGLKEKALKYRDLPAMGRTHGVHAEPVTLGFRFAGWYYEIRRNAGRLRRAVEEISVGKISGAVGTYSNVTPEIERTVCDKLGLAVDDFSTQIISRDRHAAFLSALAVAAASLEKIALQVRLLQQTEIAELAEPFRKGQKGSSAMPHKRNPILCERVCGLARVVKKNAGAALENVALWYERDISHSSAERVIFPESAILLDYITHLLTRIIGDIQVFPENIERNLSATRGLIFSQAVLNKLVQKGINRKDAYETVQKNAFKALAEKTDFLTALKQDAAVAKHLSPEELAGCFTPEWFLRNVEGLFKKLTRTQ